MKKQSVTNEEWAKVKRQCHLDDEELWMAVKLGLTPDTIRRKFVRSSTEPWKDVTPLRIRRFFDKSFGPRSKEMQ